jgi:large subunit ribosomal protein L25
MLRGWLRFTQSGRAPKFNRGATPVPEWLSLSSSPRDMLGKKVKRLRRVGLIPANLVEAGFPSRAIQVPERGLADLVRAGVTGQLVELESEESSEPVLMDSVEIDSLSNRLLHATFRKVDLTKSVNVMVRVTLVGHAPASDIANVVVLQNLTEIEISALPTDIPSGLEADVSGLTDVGDEIFVGDLQALDGAYEPLTHPEESVAQVSVVRQVEEEDPEGILDEVPLEEGAEDGEAPGGDAAEESEQA